ncbi:hypothetical protein BHK98_08920 [Hornefia porci]|uniref:PucR family transcriptional regulator n=1 Tax=Hornefia porci TaxID=2652292 RepID=A0A1Q9JIY5_9FIRM|nr:PucR family transcriptional regulator [Hornefia porci]OLR56178.1 hypothetical protein BHK98_08920 [Hornefia porci]
MALTIRRALSFGGLSDATVVAGENGLDRPLESVSVLEVANSDISKWALKNQLYITSFYAIFDDIEKQKEVVNTLIGCGCCGLVLCYVGTWVQEIDSEIIRMCDEAGFPLLQGNSDVSYIDIMRPILDNLSETSDNSDIGDKNLPLRNEILRIIVDEEDDNVIFGRINKRLRKKISYYNTYGKLLFSDQDKAVLEKEELFVAENFNHILYTCSETGHAIMDIGSRHCLVALIRSRKNLFGLFILDGAETFSQEMEETLIDALVVSGALVLKRRNRTEEYRDKAMQEYVTDLIIWNFQLPENAEDRAKALKVCINDKNRMVIININSIQRQKANRQKDIQQYIKQMILPRLKEYICKLNSSNWLAMRSDMILFFLVDEGMNMLEFCERIKSITMDRSQFSTSIGISKRICLEREIPEAYNSARLAALLGRKYYGENRITNYEEVYFFAKLEEIRLDENARAVGEQILKPLISYDEIHGTELLRTLFVLIKYKENTQSASQELYIHKNTLLQRKNKIVGLLGISPFEMPYEINFTIALMIYKGDAWVL